MREGPFKLRSLRLSSGRLLSLHERPFTSSCRFLLTSSPLVTLPLTRFIGPSLPRYASLYAPFTHPPRLRLGPFGPDGKERKGA